MDLHLHSSPQNFWKALCISAATLLACGTAQAYTNSEIVINARAQLGPLDHVASGFLHAFNIPPVTPPASADYAALHVKYIRCYPKFAVQNVAIDRAGGGNALFIQTIADDWGYPLIKSKPPWGPDPKAPDWTAWRKLVVDTVNATKGLSTRPPVYDIWNEPDSEGFFGAWLPGWSNQDKADLFFEAWSQAYDAIKSIDPKLEITGPSCQAFGGAPNKALNVAWFKDKCIATHRMPTYWDWHFGDTAIETNVNTAQSWGLNSGVLILEHLEATQGRRPGRVAYDMAQLEAAQVKFSAAACWPWDTLLGNSFTDKKYTAKTGNWYLYNFYGEMTGTRLGTSASAGLTPYRTVASLDDNTHILSAVLGDCSGQGKNGDITIKLQGIAAFKGTQVTATITKIPYNGDFKEVTGVEKVATTELTPDATGNMTIPAFNWGAVEQAYVLQVTNVTYAASNAPVLAAPTGLTATSSPSNQVQLSWSAVPGATHYSVKRATAVGSYLTVSSPVATTYSDSRLAAATTYYYVVSAFNAAGESLNSSQANVTTSGGTAATP